MADIKGSLFNSYVLASGTATRTISSSTTKAGAMFRAQKTGNIRYIGTTFTALTASPALDLRIESASSNVPSGTLFGTNTNAALSPAATNTFAWTQLTADAAVTAGDIFGVVIGYVSGTSATCPSRLALNVQSGLFPIPVDMSAGTWAANGEMPTICAKYDDGTIIFGCAPIAQSTSTNIRSDITASERASVFVAPVSCDLAGAIFPSNVAAAGSFSVNIYEDTSTTPMTNGTVTVSASALSPTVSGIVRLPFEPVVPLVAGTTYRLSVKALTTATTNVQRLLFLSTTERDFLLGPMWSDTRHGGSWLGEVTTTSELVYPLVSSVAAGGGSPLIGPGKLSRN